MAAGGRLVVEEVHVTKEDFNTESTEDTETKAGEDVGVRMAVGARLNSGDLNIVVKFVGSGGYSNYNCGKRFTDYGEGEDVRVY